MYREDQEKKRLDKRNGKKEIRCKRKPETRNKVKNRITFSAWVWVYRQETGVWKQDGKSVVSKRRKKKQNLRGVATESNGKKKKRTRGISEIKKEKEEKKRKERKSNE